MIIDPKDFAKRPYKIPNQQESRDLVDFLQDTERNLGISLFGVDLWGGIDDAANDSGSPGVYADIISGAEYTYNSKTYRYDGWVDLVRPAIYSQWLPITTDKVTNVGIVRNKTPQQSVLIEDNYPDMVTYWNEYVVKVGYSHGSGYNCKGTLYGYMKANADLFPSWRFTCPKPKNRYDF